IARAAGAVLLAGDRDQWHTLGAVALGGVENRHLLRIWQVRRPVALARRELIAQPDVAEGAANQDLVVAAPGSIAIELAALHAMLDQVASGGAVRRNAPGGRDMVGRDRIPQNDEGSRPDDVGQRGGLGAHTFEEGRLADGGRLRVPVVAWPGRRRHAGWGEET